MTMRPMRMAALYMLICIAVWFKELMPHVTIYVSNIHFFPEAGEENILEVLSRMKGSSDNLTERLVKKEPVRGEDHIIFLETTCLLDNSRHPNKYGLALKKRQACAIESAAKTNPNSTIYLLYTCSMRGPLKYSSDFVKQMFTYPNVRIWEVDLSVHTLNTPLEDWDFSQKMGTSFWPTEHSSDILRYITLWKYGGTYLDLDTVVFRPLAQLGGNFVGMQSTNELANGLLGFGPDGIGHRVASLCLQEILRDFRGDVWAHNGPGAVTRVLRAICGTQQLSEMSLSSCHGFYVCPIHILFPLPLRDWRILFEQTTKEEIIKYIGNSSTMHMWNHLTSSTPAKVGSNQFYSILAETFCPRVYAKFGDEF